MARAGGTRPRQWLRPPRQRRSDASLRRILDAAERLMESRSYADISVADIVAEARSSVGVFYSRFPDKLALLHHLDERFAQDVDEAIASRFDPGAWRGRSLAEAGVEVVDFLLRLHEARRGMLKSVILQVRTAPNQRFQQTGRRLSLAIERVAGFLLLWRDDIAHPQPERVVRLSLMTMISLIRDLVVFSETTMYRQLLGVSPEATAGELAGIFLRMIMKPGGAPQERPR